MSNETAFFTMYSELDNMLKLGDLGIVKVKPFAQYPNSPYCNEEWDMRLLNAGELCEVFNFADGFVGQLTNTQIQKQKLEMFIRSVVRRNGIQLVSEQALENYNKNNNTNLTILQLARISVNNLEQHIINAWDAAYQGLVGKQTNYIRGFVVCNNCGALLSADEKELPPIKNFDEVEYCIMCPADQREEIINDIKTEVEKKNAAARNSGLTGRNLLDKEVSL